MKLPLLPTISKSTIKTITHLFTTNSRVVHIQAKQISPHIKTVGVVIVDEVQKKADLAPDVFHLVQNLGMPISKAADKLGISRSYAYKLFNLESLKRCLPKK